MPASLSIGVVFAEVIDQLVGHNTTPTRKGPETMDRFWFA
jgi:hypothetical protein